MPTREEVRELLAAGMDYAAAGRQLGIPGGQAYMIATGVPADGSNAIPDEVVAERGLLPSSQHLANPPHENPTTNESVLAWMKARAAADGPMRAAAGRRTAAPPAPPGRPQGPALSPGPAPGQRPASPGPAAGARRVSPA